MGARVRDLGPFLRVGLGPSYPNHFFYVAGQAAGTIDNPENIEVRWSEGKKYKSWGCDAYGDQVYVVTLDDRGNLTKRDTCFSIKTVGEQLTEKGLDWTHYSGTPSQLGYMWNAYNSIGQVFHTDLWHEHTRGIDSLVADIKANNLPPVTWATPLFQLSDHPPASTGYCHNWVTDVVNARHDQRNVGAHGDLPDMGRVGWLLRSGPPPQIDDYGLGFRVPMLTISPYAKRGVIDDVVGEFSSPLKFISDNWDLPYLTSRIEKTHNFEHVFDFNQQPRPPQVTLKRRRRRVIRSATRPATRGGQGHRGASRQPLLGHLAAQVAPAARPRQRRRIRRRKRSPGSRPGRRADAPRSWARSDSRDRARASDPHIGCRLASKAVEQRAGSATRL